MHNGFYEELDSLRKDYPDTTMEFLENEFPEVDLPPKDILSAFDYLHGSCDIFSKALSDKYGYSAYEIKDDNEQLIHSFCMLKTETNNPVYIDVRGATDNFEEFISEFEDFIDLEEAKENISVAKIYSGITPNNLLCANAIIEENSRYYDVEDERDNMYTVYHGTNASFKKFDNQFFSKASGNEQYGSGFYFTNQKDIAKGYGDKIYKVKLNLKNPFVIKSGETTDDIVLSKKQIRNIVSQHPNIRVPADNEETYNPLGDWSESFWDGCNSDNPNFERNLNSSFNETVDLLMKSPTLLNVDMFYEHSGVPKSCFIEAVNNVTGHDGIIITGKDNVTPQNRDVDIYVAWDSKQIEIEKVFDKSKNIEK